MIRWRRSLRRRQHLALVGGLFCICLFLLTFNGQYSIRQRRIQPRALDPLYPEHVKLWKSLYSLVLNNDPRCEKKPELVVPREPHVVFSKDHNHARPDVMWMNEADLSRMKSAHSNFIKDIQSTPARLAYVPGTKGIIATASEHFLATLTVSLSMLRKTGSDLPVEVFLDKPTPYAEDYCFNILRPLNAQCRFLLDIFIAGEAGIDPHSYQFKIFSIIFSSFESVLLLDSDAWPVVQPDPLFHSLPFIDSGLILWPDFWYSSESPYLFEIAKIDKIPPLNVRPSTDSGMLLYNKAKHSLSLMLATYYNYYGPEYYYHLHSQGGPGEADKETYAWAATAMDEDFYFVKQTVGSLGRHDSSGEYVGTAMAQFDPVQDFFSSANTPHPRPIKDTFQIAHPAESKSVSVAPKPLFIHANHPKFNPYIIFDKDKDEIREPVRDSNGEWIRAWMPREQTVQLFGMDIEKSFWETIQSVTCETLKGVGLPSDTRDRAGLEVISKRDKRVCARINEYTKHVFGKD